MSSIVRKVAVGLGELLGRRRHNARVHRCAGLSAVILQCHLDTWKFALHAMSGSWVADGHRWDQDPSDKITDVDDGLVHVRLSGAKLAELMSVLWYLPDHRRSAYWAPTGMKGTASARSSPAEAEQATRLYKAVGAVVDRVQVNTPRKGEFTTVVIDDATADR